MHSHRQYLMLFADSTLPLLLRNFSQRRLEASQMVDGWAGVTTQEVTEPADDTKNCAKKL